MAVSKSPVEALRGFLIGGETPALGAELVATAVQQGLAGLLVERAAGTSGLVSRDPRSHELESLRAAMRGSLVRGVALLDLGARAQRSLRRRGIRSLPLKGAALAEPLYGSVGLRPMLDVDLLALHAWGDAVQALLEEGYRAAAHADHALAFVCPLTGGILELHRSVTSCPGLFPACPDGLWSRSLPADGAFDRRPSFEDLLLQLSLHASFQHGLVLSLVQWLDFRRLLERKTLDLDLVVRLAGESGASAAVGIALRTARAVVDAPVPRELLRSLELPARLEAWLERRLPTPLVFVAPSAPSLARLRIELAAGRRLRLVAATLGVAPGAGRPSAAAMARRAARLVFQAGRRGASRWLAARARLGAEERTACPTR